MCHVNYQRELISIKKNRLQRAQIKELGKDFTEIIMHVMLFDEEDTHGLCSMDRLESS